MPVPAAPKIYHIVHYDCLASISEDSYLWCNAKTRLRQPVCTAIGMNSIKQRRLNKTLDSHPDLYVGACVPYLFLPAIRHALPDLQAESPGAYISRRSRAHRPSGSGP